MNKKTLLDNMAKACDKVFEEEAHRENIDVLYNAIDILNDYIGCKNFDKTAIYKAKDLIWDIICSIQELN